MRRVALSLVWLLAVFSESASAEPVRFSHKAAVEHTQNCNSCHRLSAGDGWRQSRRIGASGGTHAVCTTCHADAWKNFRPGTGAAFCATCHVDSQGRVRYNKVVYPPYRKGDESDFSNARFDHAAHIKRASNACESCHAKSAGQAATDFSEPSHPSCGTSGCHGDRAKPAMNDCAACHTIGVRSSRTVSAYSVATLFAHDSHKKKAPRSTCLSCHTGLEAASTMPLPTPEMKTCESCHDGAAAFSALGSHCDRCHSGIGAKTQPATALSFSHKRHEEQGVPNNCAACHPSAPNGRLSFPVPNKDHEPCANCHAAEFRKPDSGMCFVCHTHNQPRRPNPLRQTFSERPPGKEEFRVGIDHAAHGKMACKTCHPTQASGAPAEPGTGLAPEHAACGRCHESLQAPLMNACSACHLEPLPPPVIPWRVASSFSHESHTPRMQGKDCTVCHVGAKAERSLLTRPRKSDCEACHNGDDAFGVTGFDCYRCHGVTP